MWTVGIQWLSVKTSNGKALYRIIPTAPPCMTLKPLRARLGPRSQAAILPVNVPGGTGFTHSGSAYGGSEALTIGVELAIPEVMLAPDTCRVAPPPSSVMVERKVRV